MSEWSDSEIVEAVRGGDRAAFSMLVDKYQKPLFNAAYRITGSVEDAADATQTAFLKAYAKLDRFDADRAFFSWLFKIAVNESLSLADRQRRRLEVAEVRPTVDQAPGPERQFAAAETLDAVQRALAQLPPEQRAVVVLRHLHGNSYDSIAEITGVPAKTVKSRLFTARRDLRRILGAQGVVP